MTILWLQVSWLSLEAEIYSTISLGEAVLYLLNDCVGGKKMILCWYRRTDRIEATG